MTPGKRISEGMQWCVCVYLCSAPVGFYVVVINRYIDAVLVMDMLRKLNKHKAGYLIVIK